MAKRAAAAKKAKARRAAAGAAGGDVRRGRRGTGNVRIFDVAKIAGVAPITVSRAVNTPDRVAAETLRRVQQAIDRTGYVPNMLAGGLASSRSRLVAAIVPSITSPVFQETIGALADALAAGGFQLMLGQSGYADSREDELLEAIVGRRPDGIVLTGLTRSPLGRQRLLTAGIPVVETWDLTPTPIDMLVGFSHEGTGAAVADYLHGRGRRKLAIVTAGDERALRRASGMIDAAARLGIGNALDGKVPSHVAPPPGTAGTGRAGLSELLARHPDIDGIFCSSDMLALGVMTECRARGIAVPERIAVVGYGDLEFAAHLLPSLTSVRVNATMIGRLAARCIIERVEGRDVPRRVTDVGFSIVARDSA
jgi:LacI family transcriptional regulator, gluconate utilization system Gnt-I transcriptional repressor